MCQRHGCNKIVIVHVIVRNSSYGEFINYPICSYKFVWTGNKEGNGDIGILLAECWVANVFDVVCISDRIILLKLAIGKDIYTSISVYAPHVWPH